MVVAPHGLGEGGVGGDRILGVGQDRGVDLREDLFARIEQKLSAACGSVRPPAGKGVPRSAVVAMPSLAGNVRIAHADGELCAKCPP